MDQTEEDDVKEIVYYTQNLKDQGRKGTVVLLRSGDHTARGVALCNCGEKDAAQSDQFNRKLGLTIARGRAWKALKQQRSCRKNQIANKIAMWATPTEFDSKCEYLPVFTAKEEKLVRRAWGELV